MRKGASFAAAVAHLPEYVAGALIERNGLSMVIEVVVGVPEAIRGHRLSLAVAKFLKRLSAFWQA